VGQRDRHGPVEVVTGADPVGKIRDAEESLGGQAADDEDEVGSDQPELPLPP
jgi:hypothetical protein